MSTTDLVNAYAANYHQGAAVAERELVVGEFFDGAWGAARRAGITDTTSPAGRAFTHGYLDALRVRYPDGIRVNGASRIAERGRE